MHCLDKTHAQTNTPNARPAQYSNRHHSKLVARLPIATGNIPGKRIVEVASSLEEAGVVLKSLP